MLLQEWFNENLPKDKMLWKDCCVDQIIFVRDKLAGLVGVGLSHDERRNITHVISTHTSKSIQLPVYNISRPDIGLSIILRNNFYNWKLSVISTHRAIITDFDGLFHTTFPTEPNYTGDPLSPVYFEGFPKDLIFGYYSGTNKKSWSAEISGDYLLYTTVFLIMRSLGVIGAFKWDTREGHRKELG